MPTGLDPYMLIMRKCHVTARLFKRADRGADENGHCEGDGGGHCHLQAASSERQRSGEVCDEANAYRTRYGALYAHGHGKDKIAGDAEAL